MGAFFFDLDGTLCDSRPGLVQSFHAAFQALGIGIDDDSKVDRFLGTPLPKVFRKMIGSISDEAVARGIEVFRQAYEKDGISKTPLYPGARELLESLRCTPFPVWLVTLKPQHYAVTIIDNLGIGDLFDGIVGAKPEEIDTKTTLIADALEHSGAEAAKTVMLGDRCHDVVGARDNGVRPVGALWGYGSRAELTRAGCHEFSTSLTDFKLSYLDQLSLPLDAFREQTAAALSCRTGRIAANHSGRQTDRPRAAGSQSTRQRMH